MKLRELGAPYCKLCGGNLRGPVVGYFFACDECEIHYNTQTLTKGYLKDRLRGMMLTACFSPEGMNRRKNNGGQQLDIIAQHVNVGKLYDVGAAGGFVMKAAQDRGWIVCGNEVSQSAVSWAKQNYDLDIFYGFLEDDPISNESDFDLIIFWNTFEHMIDPIDELELAVRMLKHGGHIHIRVPIKTPEDVVEFHEEWHTVEFSLKSLDILRRRNGLETVTKFLPDSRIPCVDFLWRKP